MFLILCEILAGSASPEDGPRSTAVLERSRSAQDELAARRLLRAVGGGRDRPANLAEDLAALGPGVAPFLLRVLGRGAVTVGEADHKLVIEIPIELEESVLGALAKLPREPVLGCIRLAAASADLDERETALRVLGRVGTKGDLDLAATLGRPVDSDGLVPTKLRSTFQTALGLVLERDRTAFRQIPSFYSRIPPALVFPTIRAVEREASVEALETLAAILGTRPETDLILLGEMTRLAEALALPVPPEVGVKARPFLSETDPERLQAAVTLAGAIEDYEAVPVLVPLLGHADGSVARSTRAALKRLARKDLGKRAEEWAKWYRAESDWWRTRSAAAATHLRGKDPAQAAGAVLDLGRRRFQRHDAALLLAEGLARPEPDLVRMCCQALGHLRSPLAVPALESARHHADPAVREAAGEALAQIGWTDGRVAVGAAHKAR